MNVAQLVVTAKGVDAVAVTALGALRSLLGFGDTLRSLGRARIFEVVAAGDETDLVRGLEIYLQRTFEFWNPNKERCWIRTESRALEIIPGSAPSTSALPWADCDHLLLWSRPALAAGSAVGDTEPAPAASEGLPRDFPTAVGGSPVVARRGEVYSFSWSDAPDDSERRARVDRAGAVRNRGEGLLVQPQYQLARIALGSLPWPAWEQE